MPWGPAGDGDLAAYHAARSIQHQPFRSACYAPFVALSFDMTGSVSVCAFTRSLPLGQVGESSLMEMWQGRQIDELREALKHDDLRHACGRCAEEIAGGNLHGVLASGFDQFTATQDAHWPTRMEFALSNACNLQCVMCSGEFSSAIRSHREGLPPLAQRYGDEFLEELTPFLPHLEQARFLGGEPFLAEVNFRIWERMIDLGLQVDCNVTTNGTQWSPRVERVLEHLPFSIGISIDGVTRGTVERVRSGASFDRIMDNLARFVEYRDRRGTSLSLTFCLMADNWHEFADYLVMAERLGCQVYVNTVRQPTQYSLYHLPNEELRAVVHQLEADAERVMAELHLNRSALLEQIDRLRGQLDEASSDDAAGDVDPARSVRYGRLIDSLPAEEGELGIVPALAAAAVDGLVSVVRCDDDDRIAAGDQYVGIDLSALEGAPSSVLHPRVAELHGHRVDVLADRVELGMSARVLSFREPGSPPTVILALTLRGPSPWSTTRLAALLELGPGRSSAVQVRARRTGGSSSEVTD